MKQKWNQLRFLGLFILCGLIAYSCFEDDRGESYSKQGIVKGNNRDLTVGVARQWYEQHHSPIVAVHTRNNEGADNDGGFLVKPR